MGMGRAKKTKRFLSEKKLMQKYEFQVVDAVGEYELLALSFDGSRPAFTQSAKAHSIEDETLTIYYGLQCPYIPNCIEQVEACCNDNNVPLRLVAVDSLEKAKTLPCIFNNWAVFYKWKFETVHLLTAGYLKKLLGM